LVALPTKRGFSLASLFATALYSLARRGCSFLELLTSTKTAAKMRAAPMIPAAIIAGVTFVV
jgi:hypothetical protein